MLDDYKLKGTIDKIEVEIESEVIEILVQMERHINLTRSEIINTALKRFISSHKDFLPAFPASDSAAKLAKV